QVVPERWRVDAHHWLILHGRYVCLARSPHCDACTVRRWCELGAPTMPDGETH
ncbi:MAG TPA: endonuclease III, partial [Rubrivivax sp.]|nr:endonuclease III [Rubrivivax sp.]